MVKPAIQVVVITYNSATLVADCIEPLLTQGMQIVVVDNASTDDTVPRLSHYSTIELIRSSENLGFAKAVNVALRSRQPGQSVLLLNPDASVDPTVIDRLQSRQDLSTRCGAIAPMIIDPRRPKQVVAAGKFPTLLPTFFHWSGLSNLSRWFPALEGRYLRQSNFRTRPRDVDWVSGGCVLINGQALDAVGGLPEDFFMYGEDVQFCLKLKRNGWRVEVDPVAHGAHSYGSSSGNRPSSITTAWVVNSYLLYVREFHPSKMSRAAWLATTLAGLLSRSAILAVTRRRSTGPNAAYYRECALALLRGARSEAGHT